MEFHPETLVLRVDETVGMAAIAIDMAQAAGQPAIGHKNSDLMKRLGRKRPEVPHGSGTAQVGLGMPLLRMDEIGKFVGIAHEEDWRVIADQVPVAFIGVELQCESPHIALCIRRAALASDG